MEFLTLDEYLTQARKIIATQKCGFLINDEDAVSHVAYRMMVADQTWDEEKSSRETWRYDRAKYAILRILSQRKKQKKLLSFEYGWNDSDLSSDRVTTLLNKIPINKHEDIQEQFEFVCQYAKNILNENQYKCIVKYHRDHKTMEDIGKEMNISKQRVSQHIKKGVGVLQKCLSKLDL